METVIFAPTVPTPGTGHHRDWREWLSPRSFRPAHLIDNLEGKCILRRSRLYVTQTRKPRDVVFTYRGQPHSIGGDWFCAGCGVAAQEFTPGDLRCPVCCRSLVEFVHSLIERRPHFDGVSKWT